MSIITKAKDLILQVKSNMGSSSFRTSYSSLPVDIPDDFLAPLLDPSVIKVQRIDFKKTPLPEYEGCYAVVLDNVLSQGECDELIHLTEKSAGAHRDDDEVPNNGWRPAMVNAGPGHEFLDKDYRNSDRIIWDNDIMTERIFNRVLQGKGIQEDLSILEGEAYEKVLGDYGGEKGERWVLTKQNRTPLNERMRFLKYGPGQFFRRMYSHPGCWHIRDKAAK